MTKRRLPQPAVVALDVIALMGHRRLVLAEFDLRMYERGCNAVATAHAIAALERRGWITRDIGTLHVTDDGNAAAIKGARSVAPKREPSRAKRTRLPRGLFA